MSADPHTVAVVMVTGLVVWAVPAVTVAVCVITGRAIRHHRARSTR